MNWSWGTVLACFLEIGISYISFGWKGSWGLVYHREVVDRDKVRSKVKVTADVDE